MAERAMRKQCINELKQEQVQKKTENSNVNTKVNINPSLA